jgi:GT2 family glycosyltransferase
VGFLGRLVAEKGVLVLLEAVARDPRLALRIAGAGPLSGELAQRAATSGASNRVTFVGEVAPDEVVEFYRSIDVLAVPSIPTSSWTEQFGRVAAEAMACGVPVVSSDAGALPQVVGDAGLIVPAGDAGALSAALVEAGGSRHSELSARGAARAQAFSWDAVGLDYVDLYRTVLHEPLEPAGVPGLEVVVVAYGAPELLRRALTPLVGLPVTVVDNSSLPDIAALCVELGVRYLDPGRNGGFAAGVNAALADRLLPAADVLLVNPDAEISAGEVAVLHRALRAEPDLASVGPSQADGNGRPARVSWPFPSPRAAWREAIGLGSAKRGPRYVIGSVLLLHADALRQLGGFDERFFLYAEETDWAYRAHRLGWRHREVTEVTAMHVGGGTSTDSTVRDARFYASQERYFRKHYGVLGWQSTRVAQVLGSAVRGVVLPGERGRAARARSRTYLDGPIRAEARLTTAARPGEPAAAR